MNLFGVQDNVSKKIIQRREVTFLVFAGVFLGSLTMLNILGITKFIDLSFSAFGYDVPFILAVGTLAYPITFLCTDFISEVFGKDRANSLVWIGLILNAWVLFILWLGGILPDVPPLCEEIGYLNGEFVGNVMCPRANVPPVVTGINQTPTNGRVFYELRSFAFGATVASMAAYLTAQFTDVHIFHFLKKMTKGKHLWLRNNCSTLVSQLVDSVSVILITHFYAHALPIDLDQDITSQLITFIISGYVFKLATALLDTIPFYLGSKWLFKFLHLEPEKFD